MYKTNYPTNTSTVRLAHCIALLSTSLTDKQWQFIKKELNIQDRKRKHDLREIWNAIFYLLTTDYQWRMLPNDFFMLRLGSATKCN